MNLFLAALSLCCCVWASGLPRAEAPLLQCAGSSLRYLLWVFAAVCGPLGCREWRLLCCSVRAPRCGTFSCCGARAPGAGASVVVGPELSSCGARASLLHSMWNLPRPGIEPASPALAGRVSSTVLPGSPKLFLLFFFSLSFLLAFHLTSWYANTQGIVSIYAFLSPNVSHIK